MFQILQVLFSTITQSCHTQKSIFKDLWWAMLGLILHLTILVQQSSGIEWHLRCIYMTVNYFCIFVEGTLMH